MGKEIKPTEEQLAYALILDWGMKIGLLGIIITFIVYVFQLLPSYIPLNELSKLWALNVHHFLEETKIPSGWAWLTLISKSDFLNFIPIAFLAGLTIMCYIRIIPILLRKKDNIYFVIALLQVAILLLAASGLLKVGGH